MKVSYTKLNDEFPGGVTREIRPTLLKACNLRLDASDKEILECLDPIVENFKLKREIAKLSIDNAINAGLIEPDKRDSYIKLATVSLDVTMEVIKARKQNELELNNLLKLSGHQLYMDGKLERLKELSEHDFKLKYSELQNLNHRDIPETKSLELTPGNPENELEELLKLTANQLYMDGKLERLKELDINCFKLKYKEVFNVGYPF